MGKLTLILTTNDSNTELTDKVKKSTGQPREQALVLADYFTRMASGFKDADMDLQVNDGDAVAASGTITFSGIGAASDTVLVNGVTFTAVASGATGNQWNVGASAAASATALKNAINGSATALVNTQVVATDNGAGVVTITAATKGVGGNAITIAEGVDGSNHMAVSGARLTGGANATAATYDYT